MAAIKCTIPAELQDKIPPALLAMVQNRWLLNIVFFSACCLILSGFDNQNGWIYFLGAILGPTLLALYLILVPLNPYHTPAATFSAMRDFDKRDPTARHLVNLMRSAEARRFLFRTAIKLSALVLLATMAITTFQSKPLLWNITGETVELFALLLFLSASATLPIYAIELLCWSFRNWKRGQDSGDRLS